MCFSACLLAHFFCFCMYTHGARMLGAWVRPPSCEQKVQECKQEEASLQRAMISELGGLAPPKRSPLSLSLSPFSRACIRVSIQVPPFISYSLLRPCSLGMAMSILHFPHLTGPYPWNVGNVYFTLLLCVIVLCMMHVYIYIYIYLPTCLWVIVHFVWWTFVAMWVTLSSRESSWPCSMGMCSRRLLQVHIHARLCARSLRCDYHDPCHQVTLVSLRMQHVSTCSNTLEGFGLPRCEHVDTRRIHRHETLPVR